MMGRMQKRICISRPACLKPWLVILLMMAACTAAVADSTTRSLTAEGGAAHEHRSGGDAGAPVPVPLKLKLPFKAGQTYTVIQGNHGEYTHSGYNEYAWDFGLPLNTPVCAAAAGRVVRVKQDGTTGGPSDEYFGEGNTVVIDHGDGYFTQYLHLAPGSARVAEGEMVTGGDVIALSGNTGFSSTPHLHFHVQDACGRSLPARFEDVPGDGIPKADTSVTSGNDGTGTTQYAGESFLPPATFQGNAIELITRNLPGHLYRAGHEYRVRGRLTGTKARSVAVYFMSSTGGKSLYTIYAKVNNDGFFDASFDPGILKEKTGDWNPGTRQSNIFSFAMAPVRSDGSFWSDTSVPVCVR